jgi:hypothetical protein
MALSCAGGALYGGEIPLATSASASSSYEDYKPDGVFDRDLLRGWNAGSNSGSVTLTFPAPITFQGVHIAAFASPAVDQTFTIYAKDSAKVIGSGTRRVSFPSGSTTPSILDPIATGAGTYSGITISVSGGDSWVMIAEVTLITQLCQQ